MAGSIDIDDVKDIQRSIMVALKRGGKLANTDEYAHEFEVLTTSVLSRPRAVLLEAMGLKLVLASRSQTVYLFAEPSSPFAVGTQSITNMLNGKLKSASEANRGEVSGTAAAAIVFVVLLKTFFESGAEREYIQLEEFAERVDAYVDEIIAAERDEEEKSDLALAAIHYSAKFASKHEDAQKDRARINSKMGVINALIAELRKMDLFLTDDKGRIRPTERFCEFSKLQILGIRNKPAYDAFFREGDDIDA